MKEIKAYIRTERAGKVLDGLKELGVSHATLSNVKAVGSGADPDDARACMKLGRNVNHMVKLEVVCPDKKEGSFVDKIIELARTGKAGDGIVTVRNINRLVKIQDAAESLDAL